MARTSRAKARPAPMIGERPPTAYAARMRVPIPLLRVMYRCAYWLLRAYWFVRRPEVQGVKCVLTDGDQVLLVRHTYGHREWDLPGGAVKRDEPPLNAARREMHEELGIRNEEWISIGQVS